MFIKAFVIKPAAVAAAIAILFLSLCGSLYLLRTRLDEPVSTAQSAVSVPIIMYHHINQREGSQGKYVLSPEALEEDLSYLQENGYETITMADLINYVHNGGLLPQKPIVLTFDDGYESTYAYVYPLLQKYSMKGVVSIVGEYSARFSAEPGHDLNYSMITWDQIKELSDSGVFEIQNHTYALHFMNSDRNGCAIKKGEPVKAYQKMLAQDLARLQKTLFDLTGNYPNTFAYPFGAVCEESLPVIKEVGFSASLSCAEHINHIARGSDCLYLLGRYNRPHGEPPDVFFEKVLP